MEDPIADNQTELTIATLMSRTDGDPVLDRAVAAILNGMQKMGREIGQMKSEMWTKDALTRFVDARHAVLCQTCPSRKYVESLRTSEGSGRKTTLMQALTSPMVMLFIVTILSLLLTVYVLVGREGYKDITGTVKATAAGVER